MEHDPELDVVEAIYDALDRGDAGEALELASSALAGENDDPVLRYLAGRALLELDRPLDASRELGEAVRLDPDDTEFRVYLAWALFRAGSYSEAHDHVQRCLADDPRLAEAQHVQGLLLERHGRASEADRAFERAAELAPDWFFAPQRFSHVEFRRRLDAARAALTEPFREQLDRVTVLVEEIPPDSLVFEEDPPLDAEQLLGLFVGAPIGTSPSDGPGGQMPPRIYLFKRNLERVAADAEELSEQIRITLYHELGHYLGLEEDQLDDSGYG